MMGSSVLDRRLDVASSGSEDREQFGRILELAFPLGERGSFSGLLEAIQTSHVGSPEGSSGTIQDEASDQSAAVKAAARPTLAKRLPKGSMPRG